MTDPTFVPPLTRIHDACAAFVAAYRTDDEDGDEVRRALAELRTALLRHREPHETEPQWRIGIEVPVRLPDEQRHTLFAAVADAVHDWEPEQRDGWDVNVYGCPSAEDAPLEDDAAVERVARALERDDAEYAAELGIVGYKTWDEVPESARDQFRRSARAALRAALRAARGTS